MELKIRKNGDVYIIDVTGEMDLYNSYKLKELVMKMLEKNVKNFVINLEQVDYIFHKYLVFFECLHSRYPKPLRKLKGKDPAYCQSNVVYNQIYS